MSSVQSIEKRSYDEVRTIEFPVTPISAEECFRLFDYLSRNLGEGSSVQGTSDVSFGYGPLSLVGKTFPSQPDGIQFREIRGQIEYFTMREKIPIRSNFSLTPSDGTWGFMGLVFEVPEGAPKGYGLDAIKEHGELELFDSVRAHVENYILGIPFVRQKI